MRLERWSELAEVCSDLEPASRLRDLDSSLLEGVIMPHVVGAAAVEVSVCDGV